MDITIHFLKLLKHLIIITLLILISLKISNKTAVAQQQNSERSQDMLSSQRDSSNNCDILSAEEYGYFANDHTQSSNRSNNNLNIDESLAIDQIVDEDICPSPPPPPCSGSGC